MTRVEGSPDPDPVGRRTPLCCAARALLGVDTVQEAKEGGGQVISMLITRSISIAFDSRIWGYGDRVTPFAEDD
jgi:hypothetical protein